MEPHRRIWLHQTTTWIMASPIHAALDYLRKVAGSQPVRAFGTIREIVAKVWSRPAWSLRRPRCGRAVARDADRLMLDHGEQSYDVAEANSWREDAGLLASKSPAHWHRVKLEIGRRMRPDKPQDPPFGATRGSPEL